MSFPCAEVGPIECVEAALYAAFANNRHRRALSIQA